MSDKKVLILGATGALGVYMTEELINRGYWVDGVSADDAVSYDPKLKYVKADALDDAVLENLLRNRYDAVIDYMVYSDVEKFAVRFPKILDQAGHYIFLSSYRVYADDGRPITETSPRLLEVTTDRRLIESNDYSIYKAREEDLLRKSAARNFTILRPSITYSKKRFQLTVLEAPVLIARMRRGKTVILPEEAMDKQATLSYSGDSAKMVAALLNDPRAFGEAYTVSTAEHHTWREIADIYAEIGGLKYITVGYEKFLDIFAPGKLHARQQLVYDRMFDRVVDNSKILKAAGLSQSELTPLKAGLERELAALPRDYDFGENEASARMDAYLAGQGMC